MAWAFVKGEMAFPIWGRLDFRAWDADSAGNDNDEGGSGNELVEMVQGRTPYLRWRESSSGAVEAERGG